MDKITYTKWLDYDFTLPIYIRRAKPKPRATILFIHGIGRSARSWNPIINRLPSDIECISVDLLGFGNSIRPSRVQYDARLQAECVLSTLAKNNIHGSLIIVGHSLGAFVAIEISKIYPKSVQRLILCSPPILRASSVRKGVRAINSDNARKALMKATMKHTDRFIRLSEIAIKYNILNPSVQINKDNANMYMSILDAAIINQTAYDDLISIKIPTSVIYGVFDLFVITKNLKYLTNHNEHIDLVKSVNGHGIKTIYSATVTKKIKEILNTKPSYKYNRYKRV